MKKSVIVLLLIGILLVSPLVLAQDQTEEQTEEQTKTYTRFNRFTDNFKLSSLEGDKKIRLALEIREKEVDSAIINIQNQGEDKAIKNLERARKKLQIVQEKVSLNTSEEVKTNVDEIINKVNEEEYLPDEFNDYLLEEEKTQLTSELTEKTYQYCEELAKEDFALMLNEEECNPETAPPGLEKELEKLKDLQYRMFIQLMLEIRSCIDDPGTCNCEANTDVEQKAKCEKMVALAMKCEYKDDEASCDELEAMKPEPGDNFARSFVPNFLMNLFGEKYGMIEYGIHPSAKVPEECQNYNTKPECKQYDDLKENNLDWDEYGNYKPIIINPDKKPSRGGTDETPPTIQEAVPECFDEKGMFLSECGEINIVWNEEGLVYIVERQIDGIITDFENKSAQHTIDAGEDVMYVDELWTVDEVWTIDGEQVQVGNNVRIIKRDMNQINNQIKGIDYAAGTGGGGGSICCKKIINGEEQYRWDPEDVCVDPESVKGEVVAHDFCLALGPSIGDDDEVITDGVPKECAEKGVYDREGCGAIMRELREILDLERKAAGIAPDDDAPDGGLSPELETNTGAGDDGDDGDLSLEVETNTGAGDEGDSGGNNNVVEIKI